MGRNTVALFIKLKSAGATPKIAQPFVIETAVSMIYERIRAMRRNSLRQPLLREHLRQDLC
jgi:hypothetical protein